MSFNKQSVIHAARTELRLAKSKAEVKKITKKFLGRNGILTSHMALIRGTRDRRVSLKNSADILHTQKTILNIRDEVLDKLE